MINGNLLPRKYPIKVKDDIYNKHARVEALIKIGKDIFVIPDMTGLNGRITGKNFPKISAAL